MKEQKNTVYWSNVEYVYDENSEEFEKLKGGFVYVFVNSFDAKEAMEKILKAFENEKLNPFHIEFIMPYDEETEFETNKEKEDILELFNQAKSSNDVVFDNFFTYEDLVE